MIVARDAGEISGFLQIFVLEPHTILIDLIAVSEKFSRKGWAKAMIAFASKKCLQPNGKIIVGTQLANKVSCQLYKSLDFLPTQYKYVMHKHS